MENTLVMTHSMLRYIVLVLLVLAIIKAIAGWATKGSWKPFDDKLNLFTMISVDLQFLLGLILFFVSTKINAFMEAGDVMKNPISRLYIVEHPATMLIGIILIHIGKAKAKKATDAVKKHKNIAIFYLIALALIVSKIPWETSKY